MAKISADEYFLCVGYIITKLRGQAQNQDEAVNMEWASNYNIE